MRITFVGLGAMLTLTPLICCFAAGQEKGAAASKAPMSVKEMRRLADKNARSLATVVQGRAVATGGYDNNMGLYAKDLGGKYPVNPCTGTPTGYTMTVSEDKRSSVVAASAGKNCGKWTPKVYRLKLK